MGSATWALFVLPALTWGAAYAGGVLAARLGQPAFVGQLGAGLLLGPTCWAILSPTAEGAGSPPLALLADLGLALMVGEAGRHLDLAHARRHARTVVLLVVGGFGLPFVVGVAASVAVPDALTPAGVRPAAFATLLGVALAMSAIPVLWATLRSLGLDHWPMAPLLVAAVAIGDLAGWLALAWAQSTSGAGAAAASGPLRLLAATGASALIAVVSARLAAALVCRTGDEPGVRTSLGGAVVVLGVAEVAHAMGTDRVLGALLAGVALSRAPALTLPTTNAERSVVPIFFAWTAAQVDLTVLASPLVATTTCVVLVVAVAVKFAGGGVAALLSSLGTREAVAVGAALNCRGAVEIAIGMIGLRAGLIGPELFGALLVMATATSVMTPAALRVALGATKREPATLRPPLSVVAGAAPPRRAR